MGVFRISNVFSVLFLVINESSTSFFTRVAGTVIMNDILEVLLRAYALGLVRGVNKNEESASKNGE